MKQRHKFSNSVEIHDFMNGREVYKVNGLYWKTSSESLTDKRRYIDELVNDLKIGSSNELIRKVVNHPELHLLKQSNNGKHFNKHSFIYPLSHVLADYFVIGTGTTSAKTELLREQQWRKKVKPVDFTEKKNNALLYRVEAYEPEPYEIIKEESEHFKTTEGEMKEMAEILMNVKNKGKQGIDDIFTKAGITAKPTSFEQYSGTRSHRPREEFFIRDFCQIGLDYVKLMQREKEIKELKESIYNRVRRMNESNVALCKNCEQPFFKSDRRNIECELCKEGND